MLLTGRSNLESVLHIDTSTTCLSVTTRAGNTHGLETTSLQAACEILIPGGDYPRLTAFVPGRFGGTISHCYGFQSRVLRLGNRLIRIRIGGTIGHYGFQSRVLRLGNRLIIIITVISAEQVPILC